MSVVVDGRLDEPDRWAVADQLVVAVGIGAPVVAHSTNFSEQVFEIKELTMSDKLKRLWRYRKAIASAAVAGLAMYLKCDADDVITQAEWWEIAGAVATAGGLTWLIPNAPAPKPPVPESAQHLRNTR